MNESSHIVKCEKPSVYKLSIKGKNDWLEGLLGFDYEIEKENNRLENMFDEYEIPSFVIEKANKHWKSCINVKIPSEFIVYNNEKGENGVFTIEHYYKLFYNQQ